MAGFFGHGAEFTFSGIHVAGMLDIPIPSSDREEVETTDMDSNFRREFVPGLIDNGTLDMTLRWVPGDPGQQALINNLGDQTAEECVITGPTHMNPRENVTFDAFVQNLGGTYFWENQAAERTLTMRVTGTPIFGTVS